MVSGTESSGRHLGVSHIFPAKDTLPRTPVQGSSCFNSLQDFQAACKAE